LFLKYLLQYYRHCILNSHQAIILLPKNAHYRYHFILTQSSLEEYNQHSQLQSSVHDLVRDIIQKHFRELSQDNKDQHSIVSIIEFGCSGGRNSPLPLQCIFSKLNNIPSNVMIYLNDLPRNDFRITMGAIENAKKDNKLFPPQKTWDEFFFTIPKTFYSQVLPDRTIDYAFCIHCIHWCGELPCTFEDGTLMHRLGNDSSKKQFWVQKAGEEWLNFLKFREQELKTNATLLIVTLGYVNENDYCLMAIQNTMSIVLKEVFQEQKLTQKELNSLVFPVFYRSREDMLEPFNSGKVDFEVDYLEMLFTPCPFYTRYQQDGDINKYAESVLGTVKVLINDVYIRSLVKEGREEKEAKILIDEIWERYLANIHSNPEENQMPLLNHYMVLRKK